MRSGPSMYHGVQFLTTHTCICWKIHPWRYQNKAKITTHRSTSKKFTSEYPPPGGWAEFLVHINYIGLIEPPDAKYQSTSSPGLFTPLPIFNTQSMRFMNSTQFTLIDIAETLWMRAEALHNICSRDCNYLSSTFHFVKFAQSGRAQAKWNVNDRCTGYWKFDVPMIKNGPSMYLNDKKWPIDVPQW